MTAVCSVMLTLSGQSKSLKLCTSFVSILHETDDALNPKMLHSTAASSAKQPLGQRKTGAFIFLNAPMMTVKEISDLCGYGNEICFMKIFKKRTGITPSEYRKISKSGK